MINTESNSRMTNLYAEWKKLRDNVQSASARLYSEKNENTERKYDEAVERLYQFEKENGIPLMAEEAKVKKMFCPQTNFEWLTETPERLASWIEYVLTESGCEVTQCRETWVMWLKQPHKE